MLFLLLLSSSSCLALVLGKGYRCGFNDSSVEPKGGADYNAVENNRWVWKKDNAGVTIVPYFIDPKFNEVSQQMIKEVFKMFQQKMSDSCPLMFIKENILFARDGYYGKLIIRLSNSSSCYNHGTWSGQTSLRKTPVTILMSHMSCQKENNWETLFVHELFHAFGITHTQRRPDRDSYVHVLTNNIQRRGQVQYEKCEACKIPPGIPYDCNSIMHYDVTTFAIGNKKTMVSVNEAVCPTAELEKNHRENGPTETDWRVLKYSLGCQY